MPKQQRLKISLLLSGFEMAMPVIGLLVGHALGHAIGTAADYVAAAALFALGIWMLVSEEQDEAGKVSALAASNGLALLALGVSISLDELAMGFTIGLLHLSIVLGVILIGAQAFLVAPAWSPARLPTRRSRPRRRREDRRARADRPRPPDSDRETRVRRILAWAAVLGNVAEAGRSERMRLGSTGLTWVELVAGRGASDCTTHQPARAHCERGKHVHAAITTQVGNWCLPVVRCPFRESPDSHSPLSASQRSPLQFFMERHANDHALQRRLCQALVAEATARLGQRSAMTPERMSGVSRFPLPVR